MHKIISLFGILLFSCAQAGDLPYSKGALVWQDNFTGGNGWSRLESARFSNGTLTIKAGEGNGDSGDKALARNVLGQETKSTQKTNYTVSRGVMGPLKNAAGYLMEVSVDIKSSGVPVPDITWEGVRFAVNYATSTTDYTDTYYGIRGDFGWKTFRFKTRIPSDVRDMSVTLGILGREGEASFRNLKFTVLDLPRRAYFPKTSPPPYKGQNLGGLRGFNSQNGVIPQLKRIAPKWKANIYKGRMNLPKEILPNAELDRWLEANIFKTWDQAPAKAAEAGVYFVMELSASPWRDPADKTGSTEFQYYKPGYADYLVKIWEKIARRYKGAKNIYGFELLNESPVRLEKQEDTPDYEEMMERIALAINKIDPERTIIVQPEEYWGIRAFETMRPINARNVVYAPHFYSPFPFTHQMIGGNPYPVPYPGKVGSREWNKELLRRDLQPARDFQQAYNVHMIVSEFGAIAAAPGREQWVNDAIEIFEEYDWDWMFHAAEEWWGWRPDRVLNRELPFDPAKWSEEKFWKEDDSAPTGQVLRKFFQKNRLPAIAPSR